MKIVKKTKEFVKENWKPIVIGSAVTCGAIITYRFGVASGRVSMFNALENDTGMDFRKTVVKGLSSDGITLKTIIPDGAVPEDLKRLGFEDVNERIKATILIQKI